MAGHSQFKNIMHRKGAQDKKRAKIFARLAKEILVAAKSGLPEADKNPRLRLAIQNARAQNMPKDNIDRAIAKAVGGTDDSNYEEIRYEGYGPGGVAVIVEALTDNRNRTASEVRTIFAKNGGSLGETGSVAFNFERVGQIIYPLAAGDAESVFEAAVEAGALNAESSDGGHEITCAPEDFAEVRDALAESLGEPEEGGLAWKPTNTIPVEEEQAQTLFKLLDALDDNDDVQSVAANFDIADDVIQRLTA
ncbi:MULTISPECIES: YebC/PmpR family DNA-binding transcriptional regulator [Limibacillus]|jgi:YebC/PmpR family DNA-binding regulatory protein|uniref:Probable transcriptional regulatory protein FHR98_001072 n=1 Tax=Limibacillus halophilus TaxID=1579333 RepID=A0A839SSW0_9PROT|nr:YebC/PmpR family DNA-binding transcriptional regulator [Limibacillus halophilus]MBB3064800.1 YebC/PmpR family DNA-binding regulatory protein [Limibacillus halophilus]